MVDGGYGNELWYMTQNFRQFYVDAPLAEGREVALPEALQHRLRTVLRAKDNDPFHLFNGKDGVFAAMLSDAKARRAKVGTQVKPYVPLPTKTLLIGQPKREAWETVLRQATEMGVTRIVPLTTAYTQPAKVNRDRASALMVEAAEQCERVCLPILADMQPLQSALAAWHTTNPTHTILWADETRSDKPLPTSALPTSVLVGPEGGFAPAERAWLAEQPYIVPMSLGPTILRTDTAVVASLARLGR